MANLLGALSGAGTGAGLGSMFGPWGTAIGAGVGGLAGLFSGKDKQPKIKNQSTLTPQQQQALSGLLTNGLQSNPLYQSGSSYLQNLLSGSPSAYAAFEAPYMQNFQQNIAPAIAERFAGLGTGASGLSSSGLQNSLAQAGRNLQTDLAGLRSGLQMQALPQALGYAQQPLSNMLGALGVQGFQSYERPGQPSLLSGIGQGLFGGLSQVLGQKAGDFFGSNLFSQNNITTPSAASSAQPYQTQFPLTDMYVNMFNTGTGLA